MEPIFNPKSFLILLVQSTKLEDDTQNFHESDCQIATTQETSLAPACVNLCQTH